MKICIFGAGAIGGYLGAKLAQTDAEVSLIARGPHLEAMQDNGLTLIEGDGYVNVDVIASDTTAFLGPQDYLFVTLSTPSVAPALDKIAPLIGPNTTVISTARGLPWWYFHAHPGPYANTRLHSADPGGAQWAAVTPEKALGCVIHPGAQLLPPGVIRHIEGNQIALGEPSGQTTPRAQALSQKLTEAATALTPSIAHDIIAEAHPIAETLGVKLPNASALTAIAPTEIDALLSPIAELGTLLHKPTPTIDKLLASLR